VADHVGDSSPRPDSPLANQRGPASWRRVLHGRDGQDPLPATHRAHPGCQRGLARSRRQHSRRSSCGMEARTPGAVVVAYVNTSAEVKAVWTSAVPRPTRPTSSAAIPGRPEVLFLPDRSSAAHVRASPAARTCTSDGRVPRHAGISRRTCAVRSRPIRRPSSMCTPSGMQHSALCSRSRRLPSGTNPCSL